jgi:hypothetical protein
MRPFDVFLGPVDLNLERGPAEHAQVAVKVRNSIEPGARHERTLKRVQAVVADEFAVSTWEPPKILALLGSEAIRTSDAKARGTARSAFDEDAMESVWLGQCIDVRRDGKRMDALPKSSRFLIDSLVVTEDSATIGAVNFILRWLERLPAPRTRTWDLHRNTSLRNEHFIVAERL